MRLFITLSFTLVFIVLSAETRADTFCTDLAKKYSENADSMDVSELARLRTCINKEIKTRLFRGDSPQMELKPAPVMKPAPALKPAEEKRSRPSE